MQNQFKKMPWSINIISIWTMILQSWLLLPWLIMRQNCGGLVKFFENTKTLLIIMWSKPNIHITELPLSSPVEGTNIKLGQGIGETHIQLGEKLNIAAWKFYLLFARVEIDSPFEPGSLFFTDESNALSEKQMHETCFSTNPYKMPAEHQKQCAWGEQKKIWWKKNIPICGHPLLEH